MRQIKVMSLIVVAAVLLSTVVYANEFSHSGKAAAGVTVRGSSVSDYRTMKIIQINPDSSSWQTEYGSSFAVSYKVVYEDDGSPVPGVQVNFFKEKAWDKVECSCEVNSPETSPYGPCRTSPGSQVAGEDVIETKTTGSGISSGLVTFFYDIATGEGVGVHHFYAKVPGHPIDATHYLWFKSPTLNVEVSGYYTTVHHWNDTVKKTAIMTKYYLKNIDGFSCVMEGEEFSVEGYLFALLDNKGENWLWEPLGGKDVALYRGVVMELTQK